MKINALSLFIALLVCISTLQSSAQCTRANGRSLKKSRCLPAPSLKDGRAYLHLGVGLLPTFVKDRGQTILQPLSLSLDYRLGEHFTMGAYAGHSVTEVRREYEGLEEPARWRNYFHTFGIRIGAHYSVNNRWEVYGGMMTGYSRQRKDFLSGDPDFLEERYGIKPQSGALFLSGYVGARFHLGKTVSVFSELGLDSSLLKAGLSFRF